MVKPVSRRILPPAATLVWLVFAVLLLPRPVLAGLFVHPHVGAGLAFDGTDTSSALTVGGTIGYGFNEYFALGADYTRLIPLDPPGNAQTNLMGVHATLSLPMGPLTPFVTAGPGYFWEDESDGADGFLFDAGAGVGLNLWILNLHAGASYRFLEGGVRFLQPAAGISLGF